jgi:hypothetical protein
VKDYVSCRWRFWKECHRGEHQEAEQRGNHSLHYKEPLNIRNSPNYSVNFQLYGSKRHRQGYHDRDYDEYASECLNSGVSTVQQAIEVQYNQGLKDKQEGLGCHPNLAIGVGIRRTPQPPPDGGQDYVRKQVNGEDPKVAKDPAENQRCHDSGLCERGDRPHDSLPGIYAMGSIHRSSLQIFYNHLNVL